MRSSLFPDQRHEKYGPVYSYESLLNVAMGTPFQYSCWEEYYQNHNILKFLDYYSTYPSIEYLTKLGFKKLVEDKLEGNKTYGVVHWRGKTLNKVLKLTKDEIKEIKENQINVNCRFLYVLKMARKYNSELTIKELSTIKIPLFLRRRIF